MNKLKVFFASMLALLALTLTSPVNAQAGIIIEGNKQIEVGQTTTQTFTIQNSGNVVLEAGILKITLPQELEFVSSSLPATVSGQDIMISIPAIAAQGSEVVSVMVSGKLAAETAVMAVNYSSSGASVSSSVDFGITGTEQDSGKVQGAQEDTTAGSSAQLPVTGMDPTPVALIAGLLLFVNFRKLA